MTGPPGYQRVKIFRAAAQLVRCIVACGRNVHVLSNATAAGPLTEVQLRGVPFVVAMLADHWYLRYCVVEQGVSTLRLRIDPRGFDRLPEFHLLQAGLVWAAFNSATAFDI